MISSPLFILQNLTPRKFVRELKDRKNECVDKRLDRLDSKKIFMGRMGGQISGILGLQLLEDGRVRALHYFVTNGGVRRYTICILAMLSYVEALGGHLEIKAVFQEGSKELLA